jgi:hypothetical protein
MLPLGGCIVQDIHDEMVRANERLDRLELQLELVREANALLHTGNEELGEVQARLDTQSGLWGGNLAFGYRNFTEDYVWGGYLGYDIQDTGNRTFHQLGLGLEALHPEWEARLNGYFPIGDRSTVLSSSSTVVDQSFTNARFAENQLLVTPQSTIRNDNLTESSLMGFDLEGGVTLTRWASGKLQGFLGSYVYGGPGTNSFVGIRGWILAQHENFNAGLSLENDRVFGTNLTFTFGAMFGGSGARSQEEETVLALLAKPLARQKNIAVRQQIESTFTTTTEAETVAFNPETNQEWRIIHVDFGTGNAANTGEEGSPLDTIAAGVGLANSANDVVYVEGDGVEAGAIVIQNGFKLLSSGPIQTIPVTTASRVTGEATLARSGSGNYPSLNNGVTFNGEGTLSGFTFANTGVTVVNVSGSVTIEQNNFNGVTGRGVYFNAATNSLDITITSNTFTNSANDAIRGEIGTATVTASITNNQINGTVGATSEGIDLEVSGAGQLTAVISGNTIQMSGNSGIELEAQNDNAILNSTVTGNTISSAFGDGILFLHYSNQDMSLNIADNVITNSGRPQTEPVGNGISRTSAIGIPLNIGEGGFGIGIITFKDGNLNLNITNNIITDSQDAKIGIAANPIFLSPILAFAANGSSRVDANVTFNILTGSGVGLTAFPTGSFGALAGSTSTMCLTLNGNTADNVGTPSSAYQFVQGNTSNFFLVPGGNNTGSTTSSGTIQNNNCP